MIFLRILSLYKRPLFALSIVTCTSLKLSLPQLHCQSLKSVQPAFAPSPLLDLNKDSVPLANQTILFKLFKYLYKDSLLLCLIVILSTATAFINIYIPTVMGQFAMLIKDIHQIHPSLLRREAYKLLALFSGNGILTFLDISLVSLLGENLSSSLKSDLYKNLLNQDLVFFDERMHGQVLSRLSDDVSEFKSTVKSVITQGLKCTTQIIGTCISLTCLSPSLTGVLLSTMPFVYLGMNYYGYYLRRLSREAKESESLANGYAGESLANIKTVKSFAAEPIHVSHYQELVNRNADMNKKLGFHIGIFQGVTNLSIGSMMLIILYYGTQLVANNEMSAGNLMAYMYATQNSLKSFSTVGVLFGQAIKAFGSGARIFEYMDLKPHLVNGTITPSSLQGHVKFNQVDFTYPTRPQDKVLDSFTLELPIGKVVAVCGPSGSGKSTVGQLLERFYDVQQGSILIDGLDITQMDSSWLRRNIGYIDQEPILFAGSIYDNIKYGNPDATRQEIEEASKQANAADFIERFPDKYNTRIGERGVTLSGGQKQRIAIARALLKNPKILICDEATSALDTTSERIVQEALSRLMKGRTVLVIAHRLSTIQSADVIVVMSRKGIVEMGSHAELLKKRGAYFDMYRLS